MYDDVKWQARLHYVMAFVGGCFGIYALLQFANTFGSAQTNNLIMIVRSLLEWDTVTLLQRLANLAAYTLGILLTLWIAKRPVRQKQRFAMLVDAIAALVLCFLPPLPPLLGLCPLSFAMATQWCSFGGLPGLVSANTFSTNNYRQFVTGLYTYCTDKTADGRKNAKLRLRFYGCTLLSFHCGITGMYLLWHMLGQKSIWCTWLPLGLALWLSWKEE